MQYPPLLLRDDIEQYPPSLPRDDIEQYVPTREQKQFIFLHHYNVNGLTMSQGYWDNTVTPGEELSVNTDRFLRNFGPIHTDGRRPEVCID